jgi:hypothetical protein
LFALFYGAKLNASQIADAKEVSHAGIYYLNSVKPTPDTIL